MTAMTNKRYGLTAIELDDHIYAIGGFAEGVFLNIVER